MTTDELAARMDAQFERMESRFTSMESRFTSMESRFTSLESRVTSMDSRVTSMDSRVTSIESRFTSMESQYEGLRHAMTQGFNESKMRDEQLRELMTFGLEAREVLRDEMHRRFDESDRKHDQQITLLHDAVRRVTVRNPPPAFPLRPEAD